MRFRIKKMAALAAVAVWSMTFALALALAAARAPAAQAAGKAALVLRSNVPWDAGTIWEEALSSQGFAVQTYSSEALGRLNLDAFHVVVVASDQSPSFYSFLNAYMARLDAWVRNGGVLLFNGAVDGWHSDGGRWDWAPGGTKQVVVYKEYNYNRQPDHPLMAGIRSVIYGFYASHGYLYNLPAGATVLADDGGYPTLAVYKLGSGTVVIGTTTVEYAVTHSQGYAPLLWNMVRFAFSAANRPPQIASVTYSPPNPYFRNPVTLAATAADPDGDPLAYVWTAKKPNGQQIQLGQGSTVTFIPDMPGAWTVTVTVNDPYGALASSTLAVNVLNHAPQITSVAYSPSSPFVNNPVTFTAAATDADGDALAYVWKATKPNGQQIQLGQGSSTTFTPDLPGSWTVTLTVSDPWGGSASASRTINVAAYELSAALEPNPAMRGQKVRVYAALTVPAPPSAAQYSGYRSSPYDELLEAEGGQVTRSGSYGYSPDGKVVWLVSGWLEARFAKPATAVYVQFNSSDFNDGYAKVYVDGTYYGSFQTQNKGHNYVRVGNLPAAAHAVRVENSDGHLHVDFFGAASEPADGARTAADSAYVVLPDGRQVAMSWDQILKRHWAEFLVPDGGSPGVWPGDGTYAVKVRAAKYGMTKEVSLPLTIQGNVKEKMYIRTLEW